MKLPSSVASSENLNYARVKRKSDKVKLFDSYIHGHFSFFKIADFGQLREEQTITKNQSTVSYEK